LGHLVGHEGKIKGLTMRQELGQELLDFFGPGGAMGTAGTSQLKASAVLEPLVTQLIEPGYTDTYTLRCRSGVQVAFLDGLEQFPQVSGRDPMRELFFFMRPECSRLGALPPSPRSFSL